MPSHDAFPKSVVLHFPPDVYQNTGATQMLPQLLQILKADELRCVQFLRGGKVRVSFKDKAVRDHHLSEGIRFAGHDIPVTRHAEKVTTVYLRDLPYEVAGDDVFDFFGAYGEVLTVERSVSPDFPSLCTGNRVVKMILKESLPYFMTVCGCECRLWYRDQPVQCFVCREFGHRAQSCPLSGLCRRCRQPGHRARECVQAWDPVAPSPVDPVPDPFAEVPTPMPNDPVPDPDTPADDPAPNPAPDPSVDVSVPDVPSVSYVNAYISALHASKNLSANFPEFDGANDGEKDSKARAYVKRLISDTCSSKDLTVKSEDFLRWSPEDIRRFLDEFCFKFSIPSKFKSVVFQHLEYNQRLLQQ